MTIRIRGAREVKNSSKDSVISAKVSSILSIPYQSENSTYPIHLKFNVILKRRVTHERIYHSSD